MESQAKSNSILPLIAGVVGIFLICLVVYFPTLSNGFIWDDDRHIELNQALVSLHGLHSLWFSIGSEQQYYPLTHTTFWIEFHLWQLWPLGYHLDNILLHAAGAIMLWRLLARLKISGGYWAAVIWAIHPLQVESVAWATERKNVLSGLLYFLSLWAYLRGGEGKSWWRWYFASLLLFFAALLAKTVTSTLPAVILLITWWRNGRIGWRDFWPLIPMFLAGAAMGTLTGYMERVYVGAVGPDFQFTHLQRLCIAGRVVWFYLWKLLYPANLSFIYPRWAMDPEHHPWLIIFAAAWVGCCGALWMLRQRIGRGPLVAALFFVGTLVPALGFVNVMPMSYSYVADHFQYLAGIGPIVLLVAILWQRLPREIAMVVLGLLVVNLGIVSFARCHVYHDRVTLWTDAELKNPNALIVQNNLGYELLNQGDIDGAEARAWKMIDQNPNDPSRGQLLLGECAAKRGDNQRALDYFKQAEQSMPDYPEPILHAARFTPFFLEGNVYNSLAVESDRTDPQAAARYRELGIAAYRESADINPFNEWCFIKLADLMNDAGHEQEAIQLYANLLKTDPDSAPCYLGVGKAYFKMQKLELALSAYGHALRIQPRNLEAILNVGEIYGAQGKWDLAISAFKAALQIDPASVPALNGLQAAVHANGAGN